MLDETFEFEISQYLDDTLSPEAKRALEARLASDSEARAMLSELRRLDEVLRTTPPAIPNLRWDLLADQINSAIDREERESLLLPAAAAPSRMRIGYRQLAMAATFALVSGLAIFLVKHSSNNADLPGGNGGANVAIDVKGPQAETSSGPSVTVVAAVGPTEAAQDEVRLAESIVTRPSRVVWIASGTDAVQDREPMPF